MAELVDAPDSKFGGGDIMRVRFSLPAPAFAKATATLVPRQISFYECWRGTSIPGMGNQRIQGCMLPSDILKHLSGIKKGEPADKPGSVLDSHSSRSSVTE